MRSSRLWALVLLLGALPLAGCHTWPVITLVNQTNDLLTFQIGHVVISVEPNSSSAPLPLHPGQYDITVRESVAPEEASAQCDFAKNEDWQVIGFRDIQNADALAVQCMLIP